MVGGAAVGDDVSAMSDSLATDRDPRERYERLLEVQGLMASVAREIGPALELERVLQIVLGAMRSLLDFNGGSVGLIDEQGVYMAAWDPHDSVTPEVAATLRVPIGQGIVGRVVPPGVTMYPADLRKAARVDPASIGRNTNTKIVSYLAVPLVVLGD